MTDNSQSVEVSYVAGADVANLYGVIDKDK